MNEKTKFTAGVVQGAPLLFDLDGCVDLTLKWLNEAADAGCDMVLFPETFIPGYPRGLTFDAKIGSRSAKSQDLWLRYWNSSFDLDSRAFDRIAEEIRKLKLVVGLGITERDNKGGTLYCSLLYFNDRGDLIGKHRKLKPTGLERFVWGEGSAEDLVTVSTPFGRTGGLICWENYMPLARMAMYEQGVEIYLAPTADARESWQASMQHIAREGRCFVLSANQFGNREGLLVAELDRNVLVRSKLEFDAVGHYSRRDIFRFEVCMDLHQGKDIEEEQ
ncbi:MAG: carbon-nitrogen hydrolase family protein [Cyclobacteriaceae bacterium]